MTTSLRALCGGVLLTVPLLAGVGLHFEENRGQTDRRVEFLSRGSGYALFLSPGEAVMKLSDRAVRMRLAGARRDARGEGLEKLPGVSNYLRPEKSVTGVGQYARVRYREVYPGIDLVYYGKDRELEYDFVIAPGADPSRIRLRFEGAESLRIEEDGDLHVGGGLRFRKPVLYQTVDGKRVEVAGAFSMRSGEVRFEVGDYRRDVPLVIDPVLAYSTYLGGSGVEIVAGGGTDAEGNLYIAGKTTSLDFPTTPTAIPRSPGSWALFVAKLRPDGRTLAFSTYLPSSSVWDSTFVDFAVAPDGATAVAVEHASWTVSSGAFNGGNARVLRLSADGARVEWIAGTAPRSLVAIGPDGSVHVAAAVTGGAAPSGPVGYRSPKTGNSDIVATRLGASGQAVWTAVVAGSFEDSVVDTAVDADGRLVLLGRTWSTDLPVTPGAFEVSGIGPFVARLSADGASLSLCTLLRANESAPHRLAIAPGGDVLVSGHVWSSEGSVPVTPGAYQTQRVGWTASGYLLRLNSAGSALVYGTYLGLIDSSNAIHVAAAASGDTVFAGRFEPSTPTTENAFMRAGGDSHVYVGRLNASGSLLRSGTWFGGQGPTDTVGLATGPGDAVYLTGNTHSTNLPTTAGAFQPVNGGAPDGFAVRIDNLDVNCSSSLSTRSIFASSDATTLSIPVPLGAGCAWWAELPLYGSGAWLTLLSGASGIGPSVVTLDVKANRDEPRTASFRVAGNTITVSQDSSVCSVTAAPAGTNLDASGGLTNLSVTAGRGCAWRASSQVSWITATAEGSGSGTIPVSISRNTGPARVGTITVAGQIVVFVQAGSGCNYALSAFTQSVSAHAASLTVPVATTAGCAWTAASTSHWITVNAPAGTSGSGAVRLSLARNDGATRRATITVAGQPFTVYQAAAACSFRMTGPAEPVHHGSGVLALSVATGAGCNWPSVAVDASWAMPQSFSIPGARTGPGVLLLTVSTNNGPERSGVVRFGSQTIEIRQHAKDACVFETTGWDEYFQPDGGTRKLALRGPAECRWSAVSLNPGVQVFPLSGAGPADLTVRVFPNYSERWRFGSILLLGREITIRQPAAGSDSTRNFIGQLYFSAFGRVATDAEIQAQVTAGRPRAELVESFMNTPEFNLGARFVAGLYVGLIGRDAEYGGWMFQRDAMARGGATPHGLVSNFLNSPEFALKNPGLDNAGFVRLMYRQILGREAGADEVAFQVANMTGVTGRVNLAVNFLNAAEFRQRSGPRLTAFLLHALTVQRDGGINEMEDRAAQVAAGTPLKTVIEEMLATPAIP